MNLLKTSFFTGIATIIKLVSSFLINKLMAVYVGPSGVAFIGQFQNFSQVVQSFANGAINNGVVKYVSEYRDDLIEKRKILSTALFINIFCSIVTGLFLFFLRDELSIRLLKSLEFSKVFVVFAVTIILFALNALLVSVLNGERDITRYVLVNISASISGLIVTWFLVVKYHLLGALFALVLNQSVVFFVAIIFVVRSNWFRLGNFFTGIDKKYTLRLLKYSLMAITTALTMPFAQMIVRNYIGNYLSWDAAGYWQGITKISDAYLLLATTILGVYYIPRLSQIDNACLLKKEILYGYKIILPSTIIFAVAIYILRKELIFVLFTKQFIPMLELFKFQLLGDILKIGSWLLACVMVAKAMTKLFIVTEIIFNLSYVILAYICLHIWGLPGVTVAFAINYFLYWMTMVFVIKIF